ncbi:MAG: GNAT family N-acetyltransferase [Pseudomonadota bacterium]
MGTRNIPHTLLPDLRWSCSTFAALSSQTLYDILHLRQNVFVIEQRCLYPDIDGLDPDCLHLTGYSDGTLAGYLRLVPPGLRYDTAAIGRVVVAPASRGMQMGDAMMQEGIQLSLQRWPGAGISLSAQAPLEAWYESLGFQGEGDLYDEDGIPHRRMRYVSTAAVM